jgi:hypothetical protein
MFINLWQQDVQYYKLLYSYDLALQKHGHQKVATKSG